MTKYVMLLGVVILVAACAQNSTPGNSETRNPTSTDRPIGTDIRVPVMPRI